MNWLQFIHVFPNREDGNLQHDIFPSNWLFSVYTVLAELARLDLLRDLEHVVRWIQNRLTDEEPAATLFALVMLRHLVVRDKLEFDLVLTMLQERLLSCRQKPHG